MENKIRIGILGYGNLGRGAELAIRQNPDMELVAVFTRRNPGSLTLCTPGVTVYGDKAAPHVGVLSFNIAGKDSAETADLLDRAGFCLRGGLHCAPSMHRYLGTEGTVRASAGPFSTGREIDLLIDEVRKIAKGL